MDDYAKAKYKKNQQLAVLKLTSDDGMLNPEMSKVDFVQDGDLNKSLKHFVSVINLTDLYSIPINRDFCLLILFLSFLFYLNSV